jgi:TonB family protein
MALTSFNICIFFFSAYFGMTFTMNGKIPLNSAKNRQKPWILGLTLSLMLHLPLFIAEIPQVSSHWGQKSGRFQVQIISHTPADPMPPATPVKQVVEAFEPKKTPKKRVERKVRKAAPTTSVAQTPYSAISRPAPDYPRLARRKGWQGLVKVGFKLNRAGQTIEHTVLKSSGHHVLDRAALAAVKKWRYSLKSNWKSVQLSREIQFSLR